MPYTPEVIDHFEHPRFAGEVEGADVRVRVENPVCGDILELTAKCAMDGKFEQVRFRAKGCVPSMAAGSVLTELLTGGAREIRREDVVRALGGLSAESMHVSYLAADAAKALMEEVRGLRGGSGVR